MGIENPLTKISYNQSGYFTPLQEQLAARLGLRLDYKFKHGHGVYAGLATSRSLVSYSFSNPETGLNIYSASTGNTQLRLEGGYQFTSKPIFFNKQGFAKKSAPAKTEIGEKSRCGGYAAMHHCGERRMMAHKPKSNQGLFVRIQPSAGLAFVPAGQPGLSTKVQGAQTMYAYNAGSYRTAVTAGAGFEFGAARRKLFTLSFNYFKSLGENEATLTTQAAGKEVITKLNSKVSGWNATIGIPISLSKNKQAVKQKVEVKKFDCQQYFRMRCRKAS